jgi:ABC-2 type transport system ATP-binding protein
VPHLKRKENAAKIGVVFGQRSQLWWDLPVQDSFELLRRIYKIPPAVYKQNVDGFTELLALDKFLNTPVRQLSLGQKMRADLAAALLHNPEILFLDEPTIGLDVLAKKQVRDFMRRLKAERRMTLILTTHDMKDVEEICERVILINEGKLMLDMAMAEVKQQLGGTNNLIVDFDQEPAGDELPHAKVIAKEGARWTYAFKRDEISANDLIAKIVAVSNVRDIFLQEPDIEDIVRGLYEGRISVEPRYLAE